MKPAAPIAKKAPARLTMTLLLLVLLIPSARTVLAQDGNGKIDESIFKRLQWRSIGPAIMGGRIDDFAVVENNPSVFYVGAATGGVWKTTNNGVTWQPVFDDAGSSSIGDIAIAPSDPNIVWVGTGEPNNRQSSSWGDGIYRSLDGGKTWQNMGLRDSKHIGRVVIDPHDPSTVYVAVVGHLWGPNKERGVFKTSDGGKTWTNSLFIDEDTGVIDIAIDPQSPLTLYAAAYQRRRTPWGFNGGGPHSGLYKTIDGGANWTRLTNGLPDGITGRIGIDIYRGNPNIVYALFENAKGGVFRSEDRGATWKMMSSTNHRPMYYSQIRIDPNNDQRIWMCGAPMLVSEDGGKTFTTDVVTRIHGDYHGLWIDPSNSNHMLAGSDGGIHISWDRGHSWDYVNTIPLGEFYEISLDNQKPYWVYGGLQDNGSWGGPSGTFNVEGVTNDDWYRIGGGDGFFAQVDPKEPTVIYTESQNGNVQRLEMSTGERRVIRPENPSSDKPYRFDWNTPIVISPHNNHTIYLAGNRIFKSTDRGDTWTASEDLSKDQDREKFPIMGALPGKDTLSRHDGQETFGQVVTLAESPIKEGLLYAGTDDGNLQISRDGGKIWKNITANVPGLPKNTYVSRVVPSRFGEAIAYATFDGHRSDDYGTYVYVTTNYGESWRPMTAGIPKGVTARVIREHPRNANLLFLGTEFGAYVSFDRGGYWTRLKGNLPMVRVDDIQIHPRDNDLVFATHGRSIWVLDDIASIEQMSDAVLQQDLHLFDIRTATDYRLYNRKGNTGHKWFEAPNPPYGAVITYYLKTKAADNQRLSVTVTDKNGKVVRELTGPKEAGVNRLVWDLRYASPITPDGGGPGGGRGGGGGRGAGGGGRAGGAAAGAAGAPPAGQAPTGAGAAGPGQEAGAEAQAGAGGQAAAAAAGGGGGFFGGNRGPRVLPGTYSVKISLGDKQTTGAVQVEEDPRIKISEADRDRWDKSRMQLYEMQKSADAARRSVTALRTQITTLQETLRRNPAAAQSVNAAVRSLGEKVDELQRKLAQTQDQSGNAGPQLPGAPRPLIGQFGQLANALDNYTAVPTSQQQAKIDELSRELKTFIDQLNKVIDEDVPALNKQMTESGILLLNPGRRVQ